MSSGSNDELVEAIRGCADSLAADTVDGAPLRVLQRRLQPLLKQKKDRGAQTLAFFLDTWIDDFFFNLAGDVPSEVSDSFSALRARLLGEGVAVALQELAELFRKGDSPKMLMAYGRLIASYLDAIDEAERLVTPHGTRRV